MWRSSKIWTVLMLLFAAPVLAQNVVVSGAITDTDGIGWVNGSYRISLLVPGGAQPVRTDNGQYPQTLYLGFMGTGGSINVSLTDTNFIKPAGSQWQFTFCPNVYGISCPSPQLTEPVTAASVGSLFSQITAAIPPPRISG